jgi:hypothetical protein
MSNTLKFGNFGASSKVAPRASFTTMAVLTASLVGCGSESTTNQYYQGPGGNPVSIQAQVPSNCRMIGAGTLNQGDSISVEVSGRSYRITLGDLENSRSREGLPPSVLLPAALFTVGDTNSVILDRVSVREGGVSSTSIRGLTLQVPTIGLGATFGEKWADVNVYNCQ